MAAPVRQGLGVSEQNALTFLRWASIRLMLRSYEKQRLDPGQTPRPSIAPD
jgi:hypothetical protein